MQWHDTLSLPTCERIGLPKNHPPVKPGTGDACAAALEMAKKSGWGASRWLLAAEVSVGLGVCVYLGVQRLRRWLEPSEMLEGVDLDAWVQEHTRTPTEQKQQCPDKPSSG